MSQTPTWVPLSVAALGVLGTLAGSIFSQIWAARREDRRWQQEKDKDERTAHREDHYRNYEMRRDAYANLLSVIDQWLIAMIEILAKHGTPEYKDSVEALESARLEVLRAVNPALLLAPAGVVKAWRSVMSELSTIEYEATKGRQKDFAELNHRRQAAIVEMRSDLAAVTDTDDLHFLTIQNAIVERRTQSD